MGKDQGGQRKGDGGRGGGAAGGRLGASGMVDDPRFAAMHRDPRFARFPKKKETVAIDSRFSGMFSDPDFQVRAAVDKRGRKIKDSKRGEDMKRYYHLKDEEEWKDGKEAQEEAGSRDEEQHAAAAAAKGSQGKAGRQANGAAAAAGVKGKVQEKGGKAAQAGKKAAPAAAAAGKRPASVEEEEDEEEEEEEGEEEGGDAPASSEDGEGQEEGQDSEEDDSEEGDVEDKEARLRFMRARGMIDVSSSGEDASGSDTDDTDDEDEEAAEERRRKEEEEEWGVGVMAANPEEPIPLIDETNRIAIVDLDWDHVKAVDILAVLKSFAPKGGDVTCVTVYPSDYGLQRMAEEAAMGPKSVFAKAGKAKAQEGEDDEDEDEEAAADQEGAEVDRRRLALYERSKLRYYYAVAEFDSVATAAAVYAECDGLEFEHSACKFDLRFVPDDQSFKGRQVRDTATSLPSGYEPPQVFNQSLQSTNPKLSWDADDNSRKRVLQKRLTEDELKQADFDAYLGSDDDGEEEGPGGEDDKDPQKIRDRYRALLLGGGGSDGKAGGKTWGSGADEEEDEDEGEEEEEEEEEERGPKVKGNGKEKKKGKVPVPSNRIKGQDGTEMEVTFVSGLENLGEKLLSKKREEEARKGETVWEAYLRKKREKRREKRALRKARGGRDDDDSSSDDYDDVEEEAGAAKGKKKGGAADEEDPFDDPFFKDENAGFAVSSGEEDEDEDPAPRKQAKGGKLGAKADDKPGKAGKMSKDERKKAKEEERQKQAELELLLMDDGALREAAVRGMPGAVKAGVSGRGLEEDEEDEGQGHKNKKKLSRKERLRMKKDQRRAAREGSDEEDAQHKAPRNEGEGFNMNLEDPRFQGLFQDHDYALDPTDPRYTKLKSADTLAKEMSKRRASAPALPAKPQPSAAPSAEKVEKLELKAMVAKLKRKADASGAAGPNKKKK